jgi:predicted DsbA family dithiol-disulfide isomerase
MPEKSLEKTVEKDIKIAEKKFHKMNIWMITSIALIVVLAGVLIFFGAGNGSTNTTTANNQDVSDKAVKFINDNLVQPGTNATFVSSSEFEGLYNVTVEYQGRNISVFLTKDGSNMFISSPLNISQELPQETPTATPEPTEIPKTSKTTAQLYVMAFCPYGLQAEAAMKPVVDLLGTDADIQVHFIANVGGTTPDSVSSLHGAVEAQEDLRQVCIMKYYNQKTYWNYMTTINNNCSSLYRDASYDACWKNAATKAGIDISKIDACSTGSEGINLLKADETLTTQYGISGSPTLLINGMTYNGARTADAYKAAICSGFTTSPAACSQNLSTTGAAAAGSC